MIATINELHREQERFRVPKRVCIGTLALSIYCAVNARAIVVMFAGFWR